MDLSSFTGGLSKLSQSDIRLVAKCVDATTRTPEDEVAWWRATIVVDRILKRTGRSRLAAAASQSAADAVKQAAGTAGIALPDTDVTKVARAAACVARALVAGPSAEDQLELFA